MMSKGEKKDQSMATSNGNPKSHNDNSSSSIQDDSCIPDIVEVSTDDIENGVNANENDYDSLERDAESFTSSSNDDIEHAFPTTNYYQHSMSFPSNNDNDIDNVSVASVVSGKRNAKRNDSILRFRRGFAVLFVIVVVCVPTVIYVATNAKEVNRFEIEYLALSDKIISSFKYNFGNYLSAISMMSIAATSAALDGNATWPCFTMLDYYYVGSSTLGLSDSLSVGFHTVVSKDNKQKWENYTVNAIDWYWESLQIQQDALANKNQGGFRNVGNRARRDRDLRDANRPAPQFPLGYSDKIYRYDTATGSGLVVEDEDQDYYVPTWQVLPLTGRTINFNQLSRALVRDGILHVMESKQAVLVDLQDVGGDATSSQNEYYNALLKDSTNQGYPLTNLYYPVFDTFDTAVSTVVGLYSMTVSWQRTLSNILPPNSPEVICVIENACDRAFTYSISGNDAIFLGEDDLHDVEDPLRANYHDSDKLTNRFEFASTSIGQRTTISDAVLAPLSTTHCPYNLHIYPSKELQDKHLTEKPIHYAIWAAFGIISIAIVTYIYDFLLQRRIKNLLRDYKYSDAIVAATIPKSVQKRLQKIKEKEIERQAATPSHPKTRIRSLLDSEGRNTDTNIIRPSTLGTAPIADMFPRCTIMFAYIHGFDDWSIDRPPQDVFILLESIFQALETIAKSRNVYKVETIRDSFLAATGLPNAQPDHAVRMARFARACVKRVESLSQHLESTLGTGTEDLRLRIGLHSGEVLAGLLGGCNFRFQLFGDTINTASRMATTSARNKIQISETTAKLLMDDGKEGWVERRDDAVFAKGKGVLETYWLRLQCQRNGTRKSKLRALQDMVKQANGILESDEFSNGDVYSCSTSSYTRDASVASTAQQSSNYGGSESVTDMASANEGLVQWTSNCLAEFVLAKQNEYPNAYSQLNKYISWVSKHQESSDGFKGTFHTTLVAVKLLEQIEITLSDPEACQQINNNIILQPMHKVVFLFAALVQSIDMDSAWEKFTSKGYDDLRKCMFENNQEELEFCTRLGHLVKSTGNLDRQAEEQRSKVWDAAGCNFDSETITVLLEYMLQASLNYSSMQHWRHYQIGIERVLTESYEPNIDSGVWYKNELDKFDVCVVPAAQRLLECGLFGSLGEDCQAHAEQNRILWEKQGMRIVTDVIKRCQKA